MWLMNNCYSSGMGEGLKTNSSINLRAGVLICLAGLICIINRGFSIPSVFLCAEILILSDLSREDIKIYRISNLHTAGLILLRMLERGRYSAADIGAGLLWSGLVMLVSFTAAGMLRRKVLGGWDIKLIFTCSMFTGMEKGMYLIFYTCIFGILSFTVMKFCKKNKKNTPSAKSKKRFADGADYIPLGPSISAAFILLQIIQ